MPKVNREIQPDKASRDPLHEVKRATLAIGKLPDVTPLPENQSYYDGSRLDFEVNATGFIYVHTPIEFSPGTSAPDSNGVVYYWAQLWIVTCKHCIRDYAVTAVRLDTKNGGTRVYPIHLNKWTVHPSQDIAVTSLSFESLPELDFASIDDGKTASRSQIERMGFYESTPVSMIGFPVGMIEGGRKNYPVVRSGAIAQIEGYLDGDAEHTNFLIDGSVFGGNSGGPVVVCKGTLNTNAQSLSDTVLIGMVLGSSYANAIDEDQSPIQVMENADLVHAVGVDSINETIRHHHLNTEGTRLQSTG